MEAVGFAVSLISLVKTYTDIQQIIKTGNNVARELNTFMTYVDTERVAFRLWCDLMEMGPLAQQIEAKVSSSSPEEDIQIQQLITKLPNYQPHHLGKLLVSGPRATMLSENISRIMHLKQQTLDETRSFLKSYGAHVRKRDRIKNHLVGLTGNKHDLRHLGPLLKRESNLQTKEYTPDFWDAARWAASGRQESIRLLEDLTRCNAGLQRLLDLMNKEAAGMLKREMKDTAANIESRLGSMQKNWLIPPLAEMGQSFEELMRGALDQPRFGAQSHGVGATGAFSAFSQTQEQQQQQQTRVQKSRQGGVAVELLTTRRKRYPTRLAASRKTVPAVATVAKAAANEMVRIRLKVPHSALYGLIQPYRLRRFMR
ncbi:hypothetical protein QBC38DRAFT_461445 [Podospora fimiseda]|uniref:Prion-inhibition and propagation HeLo domain-containing protein n=1 Tax=Podospora fimiseda TaxID=252190 RepID=A0AAN7BF16_9PEZI|nr:hypothetical protein QBC38DRAFT_461445 [Podospora fimiseda]